MAHTEVLTDAEIVTSGRLVSDSWVLVEDGVIAAVGQSEQRPPAAGATTSLRGALVLPGFVDIHVHGGGGGSFGSDRASTLRAARFHASNGTTSLLATLSTCPAGALVEHVAQLGSFSEEPELGCRLLGVHLEGPFISMVRRGAHNPQLIRPPDKAELGGLLAKAPGRIRLMTMAPEVPGFRDVARMAEEAGVAIALGHTDADGPQLRAAIGAGARTMTHTFNGMRPVLHRSPGPMEAIVDTGVSCELICDGVHVHPTFVRMLRALVGQDRLVLVTDAARWAGAPDGTYEAGDRSVDVRDGAAFLHGTETLAGSTVTMAEVTRRYARFTGAGPVELAAVSSANAARALGEDHRIGRVQPGHQADLVVLGAGMECLGVMTAGRWVRPLGAIARPFSTPSLPGGGAAVTDCPCDDGGDNLAQGGPRSGQRTEPL